MRLTELFQVVPGLVFVLSIVSILGGTIGNITLAVGIVSWTQIARLTRAEVLTLRNREFVEACHVLGLGPWRILVRRSCPTRCRRWWSMPASSWPSPSCWKARWLSSTCPTPMCRAGAT